MAKTVRINFCRTVESSKKCPIIRGEELVEKELSLFHKRILQYGKLTVYHPPQPRFGESVRMASDRLPMLRERIHTTILKLWL